MEENRGVARRQAWGAGGEASSSVTGTIIDFPRMFRCAAGARGAPGAERGSGPGGRGSNVGRYTPRTSGWRWRHAGIQPGRPPGPGRRGRVAFAPSPSICFRSMGGWMTVVLDGRSIFRWIDSYGFCFGVFFYMSFYGECVNWLGLCIEMVYYIIVFSLELFSILETLYGLDFHY